MATTKRFNQFPPTSTLLSSDKIPIDQGGIEKYITAESLLEQINDGSPFRRNVVEVSGTARTLSAGDIFGYLRCLSASTTVITIPSSSSVPWSIGDTVKVYNTAGAVEFVGSGVFLNFPAIGNTMSIIGEEATLTYLGSNSWDISYTGVTIGSNVVSVTSYAALLALTPADWAIGKTITVTDAGIAGQFKVVTGSTTSNGGTVITNSTWNAAGKHWERVDQLQVFVNWFGDLTTQAGFSAALRSAITFAAGRQVLLSNGVYDYDEATISDNIVNLFGEGMPTVNSAATGLDTASGTIIKGTLNFTGDYIYLSNLGVDRGSASFVSGSDAIKASASPYDSGRLCVLENVVGLGRSDTDAYHAILIEGYANAYLTNVVGGKNSYCGAIKSRNVVIQGFRGIGGQNTLILKSDSGGAAGSLAYLNASGIVGEGTANTIHGLRILADNAAIESLNVDGVNIRSTDRCITIEGSSALSEINISNVNGKDIREFGLVTSGDIYECNFTNFNFVELGSRAAQLLAGRKINVQNFFGSMDAGATTQAADFFRVESGVTGFTGHNIELNENYGAGSTTGTLLLNNARTYNRLSLIKANVAGNTPLYGYSDQTLSGTTNTINLNIDLDRLSSIVKVNSTADVEITNINSILSASTILPEGYVVKIIANSAFNFTFKYNSNLRTQALADVVLTVNKTISYVWGGASWHQLD